MPFTSTAQENIKTAGVLRVALVAVALVCCCTLACALAALVPQGQQQAFAAKAKYPIIYKLKGGTQASKQVKTVKAGKKLKVKKLKAPKRKGYTFVGWYKNSALTKKAKQVAGVKKKSKRTLYAKWKAVAYTISYELHGGTMSTAAPQTYTIKKAVGTLPTPVKAGYSFLGWYSNAKLTTSVDSIAKGTTGNKKLYAKWRQRTVIAHRGYHALAAENTLEAYAAAKEKGFRYVETDVRFTSDSVAVLVHNEAVSVYALDRNGEKMKIKVPVSSLTYAQIQSIMMSGTAGDAEENVTLAADFLKTCATLGLNVHLELKEGTKEQINSLVAQARNAGAANIVTWSAFDDTLLEYVIGCQKGAKVELLASSVTSSKLKQAQALAAGGPDVVLSVNAKNLTQDAVKQCKEARVPMGVWTLGDESSIPLYDRYICDFYVDGYLGDKVAGIV